MRTNQRERMVHVLFDISVISKGVDGALEIVGGALLSFVSPAQIHSLVRMLTQHELSEDPNDLLAGSLLQAAKHFSADAQIFAAVYLLWHGIVKVGLVIALYRNGSGHTLPPSWPFCSSLSTNSIVTRIRARLGFSCSRSLTSS